MSQQDAPREDEKKKDEVKEPPGCPKCGEPLVATNFYGPTCKRCNPSMFERCLRCRTPRAWCSC